MSVVSEWDNDYARIARAASQLRVIESPTHHPPRNQRTSKLHELALDKESIQTGLDRLTSRLRNLEQSRTLSIADLARRRSLVEHLSHQLDSQHPNPSNQSNHPNHQNHLRHRNTMNVPSGTTGGYPSSEQSTTITSALRQQDDMLDELASGVGRLKDQSKMIGEEAKMHVHLLDRMDDDVEQAQASMESETLRALKLKGDKSVWRLQLTIVGLSILLFILVLSGLS